MPDTYYCIEEEETAASVYFFFPKCQNIGIHEFNSNDEGLGTQRHANKFQEYIMMTSNRNMLSQNEISSNSQIFNDNEILNALKLGHFEYIGSCLLYKQPGTDGYHTNMGDLRDFIEKWSNKFENKINNVIIDSVLKYFDPSVYGSSFESQEAIVNKILESEKSISSLVKLYHYILHRRILEGKEKQRNLGTEKLNLTDISDIKMIEKRCVEIQSNGRFLKYMQWFMETNFFIEYKKETSNLQKLQQERK